MAENVALCVCVCVDIATLIVDTEDMHSRATILKCIPLIQMCLAFIGMSGLIETSYFDLRTSKLLVGWHDGHSNVQVVFGKDCRLT